MKTYLQLLVVPRLVVHLDFEGVNLQKLRPLLRLLFAICASPCGVVEFMDEL